MKKKIILLLVIVFLLVVLTVILMILKPWSSINIDDKTLYKGMSPYQAMLKVSKFDDIKKIEQHFNLKLIITEENCMFENIDCFGQKMNFSFYFNADGLLMENNVYGIVSVEKNNIMDKCSALVKNFSSYFGVENPTSYYIYSEEGSLDISQENSYHTIFDGKATLEFKVRDTQDSFWIFKIQKYDQTNIFCLIEHFIGNSHYENSIANLDIAQLYE